MAYAYQTCSGVIGRSAGGSKRPLLSSRLAKAAMFIAAGTVTTALLAVATLSATSVSTRTNDARHGGLSALMISSPKINAEMASARTFKGKKFDRLNLPVHESVSARFASAADAAVGKNPLLKNFEMALVTQPAVEPPVNIAKAEDTTNSRLLAPVETASIPEPQITGSIPVKSQNEVAQQLALAEPKTNPFEAVLNDPDLEIPLPASRPRVKAQKAPSTQLAYAAPDAGMDEVLPEAKVGPKLSRGVAIYDITAQKVYLPDGTIMEAHSGLGNMRDNPKYIKVKGRGPTPPNRYKLSMREKPFHGVPALRMTPTDWSKMHGRNGILAHTYLRKRPGDSAGCIAFKDYYKFLDYYKKGLVKEIIVVEQMNKRPTSLASLFGG
ncbi:DUF2778 domain-containing protein [Rhizobium sp. L1K21]|uniref:DUF2778 domain-containing protein n=1 Tax=Rhizobium sp. L1K21 TaxID=2954933 RepID=UPI002091F53C|nr:DUF2778 domain-containing protein [Rhizobium sp. L1K21]MCO6186651.1 DUF2778 domain-containing protein [Rhizobium sp. L1K21]